jgi:hypothetical protein
LQPIEPVFREMAWTVNRHLSAWVPQIHAGVLCMLSVAWFWPILEAMFRRLPKSDPDVEWVRLWKCPSCGNYNRRATSVCTHCEYRLQAGFLARHLPLKFTEALKRHWFQIIKLYQLTGWVLFYGLTLTAFLQLRLYNFQQTLYTQLLASAVMAVLLAVLMFFRLALRPRLKSPISLMMDLIAGLAATLLLMFVVYLWADTVGHKELAHVLQWVFANISKWIPL